MVDAPRPAPVPEPVHAPAPAVIAQVDFAELSFAEKAALFA
jgi:hypothetical protein